MKRLGVAASCLLFGTFAGAYFFHTESLGHNHRAMEERSRASARLQSQQALFLEQARALGRIGLYLETSQAADAPGGLAERIGTLNAQIAELERSLDPESLEERVITAPKSGLALHDRDRYSTEPRTRESEHPPGQEEAHNRC